MVVFHTSNVFFETNASVDSTHFCLEIHICILAICMGMVPGHVIPHQGRFLERRSGLSSPFINDIK